MNPDPSQKSLEDKSNEEEEINSQLSEEEDENSADESQHMSDLSNLSNLTIIIDVNDLLAEGRRRREKRRVKPEAQAIDEQASSSVIQTSDEQASDDIDSWDKPVPMDTNNEESEHTNDRPSRSRKPPERFGYAISSNSSKPFHMRGEDNRESVF